MVNLVVCVASFVPPELRTLSPAPRQHLVTPAPHSYPPWKSPQTPAGPFLSPHCPEKPGRPAKPPETGSGATIGHPPARPEVSFTTQRFPAPVVGGQPHRPGSAAQQDMAPANARIHRTHRSARHPDQRPGTPSRGPRNGPATALAPPLEALRGPQRVSRSGPLPLPGHEMPKRAENGLRSGNRAPRSRAPSPLCAAGRKAWIFHLWKGPHVHGIRGRLRSRSSPEPRDGLCPSPRRARRGEASQPDPAAVGGHQASKAPPATRATKPRDSGVHRCP